MPIEFILAQDPSWAWVFNQGFAAGLLLLVGFGLWRGASWLAKEFAVPLRDAALAHLRETTKAMQDLGETLQEQRQEHRQHFEEMNLRIERIDERTAKWNEILDSWPPPQKSGA